MATSGKQWIIDIEEEGEEIYNEKLFVKTSLSKRLKALLECGIRRRVSDWYHWALHPHTGISHHLISDIDVG